MFADGRLRDEGVEQPHQDAAGDAQAHATSTGLFTRLAFLVSESIEDDGDHHEGNSSEEQKRIAARIDHVIQENSNDQRQTDTHWEGDSHSSNIDGGDKKKVRDVEDGASRQCEADVRDVSLMKVGEKCGLASVQAAHGDTP